MATCDSLQPIVLLSDVMESSIAEIETVFVPETRESSSDSSWFQMEQTEPLDLCLNGTILNGFELVAFAQDDREGGNCDKRGDDDVIFVKEYKARKEKATFKRSAKKSGHNGAPRRNPVRKARVKKRFQEYTDESFEDDDAFDKENEDEENVEVAEYFSSKNEDLEDWTVEDVLKKNKSKRRIITRKKSTRWIRRAAKTKIDEKKVAPIAELQEIVESNLLLVKEYVEDIKTVNKITDDQEKCERNQHARNILKQQVILLALTKDLQSDDLLKYLTS